MLRGILLHLEWTLKHRTVRGKGREVKGMWHWADGVAFLGLCMPPW